MAASPVYYAYSCFGFLFNKLQTGEKRTDTNHPCPPLASRRTLGMLGRYLFRSGRRLIQRKNLPSLPASFPEYAGEYRLGGNEGQHRVS